MTLLIASIVQRGMIDFGGYREDEALVRLLAENLVTTIFPDLEDTNADNDRLIKVVEDMDEMYFA